MFLSPPAFIEQEPIPRIRQGALAALSRTSRTWYSIVNSILYLKPVLFNEKRAKQWSIVYSSRITPWTVNEGNGSLQNIIVPESVSVTCIEVRRERHLNPLTSPSLSFSQIVFNHDRKVDRIKATNNSIFPRLESPLESTHLFETALAPFFFRNLTSFSVSRSYPTNGAFVAGLLGLNAPNRLTITRLKLQSQGMRLFWFLFEAIYYIEHQVLDKFAPQVLDQVGPEIGIEKGTSLDEVNDEIWEEIEMVAQRIAPVKWDVYKLMQFVYQSDDDFYEDIVKSRILKPTAFSQGSVLHSTSTA